MEQYKLLLSNIKQFAEWVNSPEIEPNNPFDLLMNALSMTIKLTVKSFITASFNLCQELKLL